MTLNEFLAKAGQLLGLAEKNLTAEQEAASLKADLDKLAGELATAKADLTTAKASIASLSAEKEKFTASVTDLTAKLEAKGIEVEAVASRKALDITAAQGQAPVVSSGAPIGKSDILAEHDAIKDPAERTAWYRKNKATYDAAHKAQNPGDMKLGPATKK